jgi:pimeloyl-ACP methyl ester carboxylesterase
MAEYALFKKARIHYSDQGKGPVVVLLHGFMESTAMWKNLISELQSNYRIIAIDLPGHGKSECLGYVHTMEDMADAVWEVLRKLKIRKPIILGHSMGGYVGLAYIDRHPDHCKALCLYHSTSKADSPQRKKGRNQAIELVKSNHKSFVRKAFPMLFRYKFRKSLKEKVSEAKTEALKTPKQGIIAALEGMKRRPSREVILKFPPCPIYIIAGHKDPVIDVTSLKSQMKLSKHCGGEVIKEAGHMSHIETPDQALEAIKGFLSSTKK